MNWAYDVDMDRERHPEGCILSSGVCWADSNRSILLAMGTDVEMSGLSSRCGQGSHDNTCYDLEETRVVDRTLGAQLFLKDW